VGESLPGGWHLEERIGADAIARLFRATDPSGQSVIVRISHDHLIRNRTFSRGLARAVEEALRVKGPGVLRLLGAGATVLQGQARLYLLSESFEGRNLCSIVQARGVLPVSQVFSTALDILDALEDMHRQGIVHGDILPECILIGATEEGEVRAKVVNHVLGRLASVAIPRLACGGTASGTSRYMAPELAMGEPPSVFSDIYSFGAVLYQMLTGIPPRRSSCCLLMERQWQKPVVPPSMVAKDRTISSAVDDVLLRALDREPSRRFSSASEMRQVLWEAKNESPAVISTPTITVPSNGHRLFGRQQALDIVHTIALMPVAYGTEDQGHPRGAVAVVVGSAGVGKTALLRAVRDRLEGSPVAVLRVDGRRALTRPLEPFITLVQDVLGVRRGDEPKTIDEVRKALVLRFGIEEQDCLRLLERVTDRESSLSLTPDIIEREQVRSLRAFLGRMLASRPTVLVVEDADAMDTASLELTRDLMEASSTLALSVLVSCRSDPYPDWDAGYVTRLHLDALDEMASKSMLEHRTMGMVVPSDAMAMAVQWSKGVPLLLELTSRAMRQREFLVEPDGTFKAPSTSQDLFGGLRQLVSIALRDRPVCVRQWIFVVAIAGGAPIELLEAYESSQGAIEETIGACLETGWVSYSDEVMEFDNEGVRDVVRSMIPEGTKRQMHAFVAKWLQQTTPARAPGEVIASHLVMGGDVLGAAQAYEKEAIALSSREEHVAATVIWGRAAQAWQMLRDEQALCRVAIARTEAFLAAGNGKAATEELSALERFEPAGLDGLRARAMAAVASSQSNWDLAIQSLLRASALAVDNLDQQAWFDVEFCLGELLYRRGELGAAESHATTCLDLAISIADSRGERATLVDGARIAQAATFLSKLRIETNRMDKARNALAMSLEHTAILGDEASASRLLANLAYACEPEDLEASLSYAKRALELALRAGDRMAAARIAINLGAYQAQSHAFEDALASYAMAKKLALAVGWARGVRLAKSAAEKIHSTSS